MKQPQLSGIATALAKQGRHGDDTLIHVSRKELETLQRMGDGLGVHLTRNPQTGLPEAFNWLGTLGGIAGGVIGTFIAPGAGTAAGAALGSGLGTAAGGGSLKQALIAGAIGGITGYIGGAGAGELATAGEQAIGEEATKAAVQESTNQALADTAGGAITNSTYANIPSQTFTDVTANMTGNNVAPIAQQEALSNLNASYAKDAAISNASNFDKIAAGWNASSNATSPFAGQGTNLLKVGAGLAGVGAIQPTETNIVNPDTTSSDKGYRGETYIDPATGQMRTRAVRAAEGGLMFSDYDAADADADGGYSPGGGVNFDTGGIATLSPEAQIAQAEAPAWLEEAMKTGMPTSGRRRRRDEFDAAKGGIGDLGGYSDGGRMLRGPGDGVSDSIPASIENKRPARLADGEFVVPARAVSELGNGSTEAGSKQLYKMLDRIASKRKSGKGLAYEANPKKLLPA